MATILIVDDRPTNRDVLTTLLGYRGHRTLEAGDGAEALALAEHEHIDLIISDILMPTMDGFELVRRLRADPRIFQMPVMFVTATFLYREAAALAEAVDVTQIHYKPIDPAKMLAAVDELLGASMSAPQEPRTGAFNDGHLRLLTDKLIDTTELLKAANDRLHALFDLTVDLGSKSDPTELIKSLCRAAREIFAARHAGAGMTDPATNFLRGFVSYGSNGTNTACAAEPRPLPGVLQDPKPRRFKAGSDGAKCLAEALGLPPDPPGAVLAVPIASLAKLHGWLCLIGKVGLAEFTDEDEDLIGHFAAVAGRIYENRTLYRELEIRAQALEAEIAERNRVERERAALESQLLQAQKLEAVGQLTGGLAHDFNNLLGVVIGNLDLLRPQLLSHGDAGELVDEAVGAALRGADLTRRLLAFARQQPLRLERIAINTAIAELAKLLTRVLGENIEVELDLAPDAWPVVTDPTQFETSLTNLATNARDAMPRGGKLSIATRNRTLDAEYAAQHPELTPGDYTLIEVSDTGTGIAPDVLDHIFEPFYTTKQRDKGTGLGLSMVFGFIKQSGGHITVYSEPGIGTTFRLYLARAPAGPEIAEQAAAAPVVLHGTETVLVVEDNPGLRRVAVRQLSDLGYAVIEADNAAAAIATLETRKADLVFSDIVMPGGVDGIELAAAIIKRWPAVKVVLTSGFTGANLNPDLASLGPAVRLLSKPYRRVELASLIRTALEG